MSLSVPVHLGLVLDGNRRWAKAAGVPTLEGHRAGYETLRRVALLAVDRGVKYVSAYVFSTENWNRSKIEVSYLMDFIIWVSRNEIERYIDADVKLVFAGSRRRLSAKVLAAIESAEERTRYGSRGVLVLCLNYGGHTELAEGVARLVRDGVPADEVTPEKLSEYLYHPEVPAVDLVIRTSGEQRLSNFMLWRVAYAELYFSSVLWPAFSDADLDAALAEYSDRQRRFGR